MSFNSIGMEYENREYAELDKTDNRIIVFKDYDGLESWNFLQKRVGQGDLINQYKVMRMDIT